MHFALWVLIHALVMHLICILDAPCYTHSNTLSCLGLHHVPLSIVCHMFFMLCSFFLKIFFVLCLSFIFSFILHPSCIIFYPCHIFFSFPPSSWFICLFMTKRGSIYFLHFYITLVHILRGRNSISRTFVGRESHRGDAYTKKEKTFFWENLGLLCLLLSFKTLVLLISVHI